MASKATRARPVNRRLARSDGAGRRSGMPAILSTEAVDKAVAIAVLPEVRLREFDTFVKLLIF